LCLQVAQEFFRRERSEEELLERVDILLGSMKGFRGTQRVLNAGFMFSTLTNAYGEHRPRPPEMVQMLIFIDVVNLNSIAKRDYRGTDLVSKYP
jgi:hypothetical protein